MDRFIHLFRHHPDPIFLADPTGRIVYWNVPAEEMLKIPYDADNVAKVEEEAVHRFHPSLDNLFRESLENMRGASSWVLPLPLDPCLSPIKITIMPISQGDTVTGAWGVCHTDEKQEEPDENRGDSLIRRINSFLLNTIESTVNGIVVMDTRGKVLIFNRSMEKMTGFRAEQVVGVPGALELFYGWETAKGNMAAMRGERNGPPGRLVMHHTTLKDRDGNKIPVSLSAAIIKEGGVETGSVGVFSDLRERKRMEKELRHAQENLVEADKAAALGRLSASVAHEINNPLSGILMFAEILQKRLDDDQESKADLQEIIDQTLRCKSIVRNLLDFSRKSSGDWVGFALNKAFKQCLDIVLPQSRFAHVDVACDFCENMPDVVADRVKIQQVFINLLLNAADSMETTGGMIHVATKCDSERDVMIATIRDTGPGIVDEERERIFESFYTTKPVGYGTGLGLSISREIIKAHGGGIWVDNHPEGGAVFTVEIPRRPGEQ
ncbi:MAG: ATP-binding protein [Desulfatibacillaceae bacterium]